MPNYTKLALTAQRLIESSGRDVTIVKLDQGSDDANKDWRGKAGPRETPEASVNAKGVFVPLSSSVFLGIENLVPDERRGNQVCLVAANADPSKDLTTFDEINDGGSIWRIVQAQVLKPGDVSLLYAFEVKR